MGTMGFFVDFDINNILSNKNNWNDDCILQFDSGAVISFHDAVHHSLVTGTTGSGKTSSVVLPALARLFQAGFGGFIVDIKGSLTQKVRDMATACRRIDDIVELGSEHSAIPQNIMGDMKSRERAEFLRALTRRAFESSSNMDFHMVGVSVAIDCLTILDWLAAKYDSFTPCLAFLDAMLHDYTLAASIFSLFLTRVYDCRDRSHKQFVQRVRSDEFHILMFEPGRTRDTNYVAQMTYRMKGVCMGLAELVETPGIMRGFSTTAGASSDVIQQIFLAKKVVILRFGPQTGEVGAWLARIYLERFYKCVYEHGLQRSEGQYTFCVLDELQEFCDLGPSRFSDARFVAQAREFGNIFIAATQSLSALAARARNLWEVDALVSNCNNRVLLYSDDPVTQAMAERFEYAPNLAKLKPGQAFVIRFDAVKQAHSCTCETLSRNYTHAFHLLKKFKDITERHCITPASEKPCLGELVDAYSSSLEMPRAILACWDKQSKHPVTRGSKDEEACRSILQGVLRSPPSSDDAARREMEKIAAFLTQRHARFFSSSTPLLCAFPAGWASVVDNALETMRDAAGELTITALLLEEDELRVRFSRGGETEEARLLADILGESRYYCPFCGHIKEESV